MDNSTRLEPCDITPCGVRKTLRHHNKTCQENCTIYNCGTESLRQMDYRGFQNITASGRVCQRWDSQFPHQHGKTPTNLPNAGLEGNYCRNPDGLTVSVPRCMAKFDAMRCDVESTTLHDLHATIDRRTGVTLVPHNGPQQMDRLVIAVKFCAESQLGTAPNLILLSPFILDLCEVPYCPEEVIPRRTCGSYPKQKDYRGAISKTQSGLDCVAWATSAEAASLGFTPEDMPNEGLVGAYCRNPGHERNQSWCYVDNPNSTSTWEFCDVPDCKECGSPSLKKEDYRGLTSTTRSGKVCLSWVNRAKELMALNLTMDYFVLEDNFCRNLMGYRGDVWCFVEGESPSEWEYCDVPDCEEETTNALVADPLVCGSVANHQSDYRGTINVTVSGRACQPWASQSPHQHKHSPEAYPLSGLDNNWCRNPDGPSSLGAWCYTQDPEVLWEYCLVPSCSAQVSNTTCGSLALKQQVSGWSLQIAA
jgi:apolipoprotein(a)